jgi:hypothetical protein
LASALNYPVVGFKVATETKIFRAFDAVLRNDPMLSSLVQTWASWRGEDIDLIELPPVAAMCPFLRVSPWPTSSDLETEQQHKMPLTVRLELAVVGTNTDVLMNFCGQVRLALFPQDDPVRRDAVADSIRAAGATRPVVMLNAFGIIRDPDEVPILIGQGSIQFSTLVFT